MITKDVASHGDVMRCVGFLGCYLAIAELSLTIPRFHHASRMLVLFCKPSLQYCYKENTIIMYLACWFCFVSPSLQCFYKENTIIMHLACWFCFVNPSLQCCYKESTTIMHLACWLCFVNPSLQYCYKEKSEEHHASRMLVLFCKPSLQDCYKENIRIASCISHVGCV